MKWSESYQAGVWLIFLWELETCNILPDERKIIRVSSKRLGVLCSVCIHQHSASKHQHELMCLYKRRKKKKRAARKSGESWRSEQRERWGEMRNCHWGNFKQQQHAVAVTYCYVFERVWWRLWPAAKNSSCGNVSSKVWKCHSWKLKRFYACDVNIFILSFLPVAVLYAQKQPSLMGLCFECVSFEYDGVLVELLPASQWKSQLKAILVRLQLRLLVQKNPLRGSN